VRLVQYITEILQFYFASAAFIRLVCIIKCMEKESTHFHEHRGYCVARIYYWKIHVSRLWWFYWYLKQIYSLYLANYSMEDKMSVLILFFTHYVILILSLSVQHRTSILSQFIRFKKQEITFKFCSVP